MTDEIQRPAGSSKDLEAVIERLRREMEEEGHTMTGLSERLGYGRSFLNHAFRIEEDGSCRLKLGLFLEILRRLGRKPSEFFAEVEREWAGEEGGASRSESDEGLEEVTQLFEEALERFRRKHQK